MTLMPYAGAPTKYGSKEVKHRVRPMGTMRLNELSTFWIENTPKLVNLYTTTSMTYGEIAAVLGLNKNAVVGRIHRLIADKTLTIRARTNATRRYEKSPERSSKELTFRPVREAAIPAVVVDAFVVPEDRTPVSFADLDRHQCRWPWGAGHCGCAIEPGKPYCAEHVERAKPPSLRRA